MHGKTTKVEITSSNNSSLATSVVNQATNRLTVMLGRGRIKISPHRIINAALKITTHKSIM